MSQRIKQILEVIEEVREQFLNRTGYMSLKNMRLKAVASVAYRRPIKKQTVLDKFIRQLKPDVDNASEFDMLLEDWLINDSDKLKNIIMKHRADSQDVELINNAFYKPSEPELLLAQEYGFDPNEESFKEGKIQLKLHLIKERNRSLVTHAKEIWNREQMGQIHCSICAFSYQEAYGDIGEGFMEAHHTKPISSITPDTIVSTADLLPVCSNCHTMLHHHHPWLTVEQLRKIFLEHNNRLVEA